MGHVLTRDAGDMTDETRPATFTSDRGWTYRLLPSTETEEGWNIWPDAGNSDLRWMGYTYTYTAVPMYDRKHGYCFGYEVRRTSRRDPSRVKVIGYAENLLSMASPVESDLLRTMDYGTGPGPAKDVHADEHENDHHYEHLMRTTIYRRPAVAA